MKLFGERKEEHTVGNGGCWGGILGILMAANTLSIGFFMLQGDNPLEDSPGRAIALWCGQVLILLICSGSLAMSLAAAQTAVLKRLAPRFGSRKHFFLAAILMGLPLGLLTLALTLFVMLGGVQDIRIWTREVPGALFLVIAAGLTGGAGMGTGAALAVPFKRPASEVEPDG